METREPGGTPLAEKIRSLLLGSRRRTGRARNRGLSWSSPRDRQHVTQVIEPALARGSIVLCDRFSDSTLAYQGYRARTRPLPCSNDSIASPPDGLTPDLTLVFDLPVSTGLARRRSAAATNRLDRESLRFHRKVRAGFLDLAKRHPTRIKVLSARASKANRRPRSRPGRHADARSDPPRRRPQQAAPAAVTPKSQARHALR